MSYRFHHLHVICRDLEGMIDFFTTVLGGRLVARQKFGTADGAGIDLQGTTINLRMAREDEDIQGDAAQTRYGFDHIGLQVDDLEAAYQELRDKGYSFFMDPKDIPGLRIAFFKGPEALTIELVQVLGDRIED